MQRLKEYLDALEKAEGKQAIGDEIADWYSVLAEMAKAGFNVAPLKYDLDMAIAASETERKKRAGA